MSALANAFGCKNQSSRQQRNSTFAYALQGRVIVSGRSLVSVYLQIVYFPLDLLSPATPASLLLILQLVEAVAQCSCIQHASCFEYVKYFRGSLSP